MGCDRGRRRDRASRARRRRRGIGGPPGVHVANPSRLGVASWAVWPWSAPPARVRLTTCEPAVPSVRSESAAVLEVFDRDVLLSTGRSIRVRAVAAGRHRGDAAVLRRLERPGDVLPVLRAPSGGARRSAGPDGRSGHRSPRCAHCSRRRRRGRHRRVHPRARAVGSRSGVRSGRQPPARGDRHAAAGGLGTDRIAGGDDQARGGDTGRQRRHAAGVPVGWSGDAFLVRRAARCTSSST